MSRTNYVCVHGHFYQPPRENAWTGRIDRQESAAPYHDWNERIADECYGPNAWARALDSSGKVADFVSNYARMSFNFGPTLLSWLEAKRSDIYASILEADRAALDRFGYGAAIAQSYNHMIMPLASERDLVTQVRWGIADFVSRFGRDPAGMWLAETAAGAPTLDALAACGVRFTILAPRQAARARPLDGSSDWIDVSGGRVDPTRPYVQRLASGRSIVVFFYDGPISQALAFEGLLESGDRFAAKLRGAVDPSRDHDQLVHIATDGETYGHHKRHAEMALSWALEVIDRSDDFAITNYAAFLEGHEPSWEIEIVDDSSWSCAHGVERWRSNCGCSTGGDARWNQAWRAPLRASLDELRDEIAAAYAEEMGALVGDAWAARDAYVEAILDPDALDRVLDEHLVERSGPSRRRAATWLECARHAMLMYTSCGWFFNEVSGIETVQVIEYAGRAIHLYEALRGDTGAEARFIEALRRARSNLDDPPDAGAIYERWVRPQRVGPLEIARHAVASLALGTEPVDSIAGYRVTWSEVRVVPRADATLVAGRIAVDGPWVDSELERSFTAIGVKPGEALGALWEGERPAPYDAIFEGEGVLAATRALSDDRGALHFDHDAIFSEERFEQLRDALEQARQRAVSTSGALWGASAPLASVYRRRRGELPFWLSAPARVWFAGILEEMLVADATTRTQLEAHLARASALGFALEPSAAGGFAEDLARRARGALERDDRDAMHDLADRLAWIELLPFAVDTSRAQRAVVAHLKTLGPDEARPDELTALISALHIAYRGSS